MTKQDALYEKKVYRRELYTHIGQMFRRLDGISEDFGVLFKLYQNEQTDHFEAQCIRDAMTSLNGVVDDLYAFGDALRKLPIELPSKEDEKV
jgi:hypothetical protein